MGLEPTFWTKIGSVFTVWNQDQFSAFWVDNLETIVMVFKKFCELFFILNINLGQTFKTEAQFSSNKMVLNFSDPFQST